MWPSQTVQEGSAGFCARIAGLTNAQDRTRLAAGVIPMTT